MHVKNLRQVAVVQSFDSKWASFLTTVIVSKNFKYSHECFCQRNISKILKIELPNTIPTLELQKEVKIDENGCF